jgi:hypothetical protein
MTCSILALFQSGCASNPNSQMTEIGFIDFVVKQISKDEFQLELNGPGAATKNLEAIDALYEARAKELCGGRRFLSNVSNSFPQYRTAGAFGASLSHKGIRRSGTVICQNL